MTPLQLRLLKKYELLVILMQDVGESPQRINEVLAEIEADKTPIRPETVEMIKKGFVPFNIK